MVTPSSLIQQGWKKSRGLLHSCRFFLLLVPSFAVVLLDVGAISTSSSDLSGACGTKADTLCASFLTNLPVVFCVSTSSLWT